jgi:hypothetical protein
MGEFPDIRNILGSRKIATSRSRGSRGPVMFLFIAVAVIAMIGWIGLLLWGAVDLFRWATGW